ADTVSSSPQISPLTRASVKECATSRSRVASIVVRSGDFGGLDRVEIARPYHGADPDQRVGLQKPERTCDVPPGVIGVAHDVTLGREPDVLAFERMAERNVRDLLRQPDRQADMRAIDRVAQTRIAGTRGVLGPALAVHGVEL